MTRRKTADTDTATTDIVLEQPQTGGSFIRQDDGTLLRVEHPPVEADGDGGDDDDGAIVDGQAVTDTPQEQ